MSSFTRPPRPFGFSPDFSEGTDAGAPHGSYGARLREQPERGRSHPDPYGQESYGQESYGHESYGHDPHGRDAGGQGSYSHGGHAPSLYDPYPYDGAAHDVQQDNGGAPSEAAAGPSWLNLEQIPSWLRPFTLDANTRFTRTPDHFLRPRDVAAAVITCEISNRGWRFVLDPSDGKDPPAEAEPAGIIDLPDPAAALAALPPAAAYDPEAATKPFAPGLDGAGLPALDQDGADFSVPDTGLPDFSVPDFSVPDLGASNLPVDPAAGPEPAAGAADLAEDGAVGLAAGAPMAAPVAGAMEVPAFAAPGAEPPAAPVASDETPCVESVALVDVVAVPEPPEMLAPEAVARAAGAPEEVPPTLRPLGRLLLLGADAIPPVMAADQDLMALGPLEMAVAGDGMDEAAFAAERQLLDAARFDADDDAPAEGDAPFVSDADDAFHPLLDAVADDDEADEDPAEEELAEEVLADEDAVEVGMDEAETAGDEDEETAADLIGDEEGRLVAEGLPEDTLLQDEAAGEEAMEASGDELEAAGPAGTPVPAPSVDAPSADVPSAEVPSTDAPSTDAWPFVWRPYQQSITARFIGAAAAPGFEAAAVAPVAAPAAAAMVPAPAAALPPAAAPALEAAASPYDLPPLDLLREPPVVEPDYEMSEEFLDQSSSMLQQVLRDFGVRGEVIDANPGPVVTLYEFEPAPGVKSSRVIGLSPDIARSMSAVSARVAVVEGRNVIGIELPNRRRETVWLRELLASHEFADTHPKLGLCLGKTIGGVPVIADLARMPHLLVAGTTGSGKSVAINTMILSLLYRHTPEACRLIMIDPKMLELSVYEGIPHLLTPVVTDPKKAIIALKWAVKEMEERYRKMSRLAVRNIDGFNARVKEAAEKGEVITRSVQVGFDKESGEALFEEQEMDLTPLPYIVVIVDEMADLMMVAGKEIEGAIQRLAQMARAAGIHLVMATQRPSVDVITGTIKANFPTRISFQVTSKIDSRTILGEMGAETLLGQGDMLFMAGGGRIMRVHGPFVSDGEVEKVVAFLKAQGGPDYLDAVILDETEEADEEDEAVFDRAGISEVGGDLYEQAIAIVMRDRKASTSYIQRRLQVGYNKAASLMERMETEGIVGPANHAGKREILTFSRPG